MDTLYDCCIVGGAGHVGAPLAVLAASRGYRTLVYDIDGEGLSVIASGKMPHAEAGGDDLLRHVLSTGQLGFSSDPAKLARIPYLLVTVGTPVDEFQNPRLRAVTDCIDAFLPSLSDEQLLILRSTVCPGTTEYLGRHLALHGKRPKIAFCPERVVQGQAIREIPEIPQIVSGLSLEAADMATAFFSRLSRTIVRMNPREAEFAKLVANAYRYIQFAATNQFYMMAVEGGLDYGRVVAALKHEYPRLRDFPGPGLSAGPCLHKDTLQLAAYACQFSLGQSAIQINEGLPMFIVRQLAKHFPVGECTVGLLGMAFKSDCDDPRSSLSYKLKKLLRFQAREVLTTDPHVRGDPDILPLDDVLARSDVLIKCCAHSAYAALDFRGKPIFDLWSGAPFEPKGHDQPTPPLGVDRDQESAT